MVELLRYLVAFFCRGFVLPSAICVLSFLYSRRLPFHEFGFIQRNVCFFSFARFASYDQVLVYLRIVASVVDVG